MVEGPSGYAAMKESLVSPNLNMMYYKISLLCILRG